jgi:hypothetical protein
MDLLHDLKEGSRCSVYCRHTETLLTGSRSKIFSIGPATSGSDISSVKCTVCRLKVLHNVLQGTPQLMPASLQVMGIAAMCGECGHAGHPNHILAWFAGIFTPQP